MEMYLKTILRLEHDESTVRVKAIADSLGVTMPSVSEALRTLQKKGLVEHSSYGEVESHRRRAPRRDERERAIRASRGGFFANMLRVDEETADREACEIEHVVGEDDAHAARRVRRVDDESRRGHQGLSSPVSTSISTSSSAGTSRRRRSYCARVSPRFLGTPSDRTLLAPSGTRGGFRPAARPMRAREGAAVFDRLRAPGCGIVSAGCR